MHYFHGGILLKERKRFESFQPFLTDKTGQNYMGLKL